MRKILSTGGIRTHILKEAETLIRPRRLLGHTGMPDCFPSMCRHELLQAFLPHLFHVGHWPSLASSGEHQQPGRRGVVVRPSID